MNMQMHVDRLNEELKQVLVAKHNLEVNNNKLTAELATERRANGDLEVAVRNAEGKVAKLEAQRSLSSGVYPTTSAVAMTLRSAIYCPWVPTTVPTPPQTEALLQELIQMAIVNGELVTEKDALTTELAAERGVKDALAKELATERGENDALANELAVERSEKDALTTKLVTERGEKDALTTELAAERGVKDALAKELATERGKKDTIIAELATERGEKDALTTELAAERGEKDALASELAAERGENDALANELAVERSEKDALTTKLATERGEKDALTTELAAKGRARRAHLWLQAGLLLTGSETVSVGGVPYTKQECYLKSRELNNV